MNLSIEKLPECRAKLSAEVPAESVKSTRDVVVNLFMAQAKLPGFRPGKLPKGVVEKKFSSNIEEELRERLTRDIIQKAVQEEELPLLGIANVERDVFEQDGTYSYVSEVVIKPEVELSEDDYKGIEVEVVKSELTEEMTDDFLKRVQQNFTEYSEVERAAEVEDRISVSYSAEKDGEPLADFLDDEKQMYLARTDDDTPLQFVIPKEASQYEPIPGFIENLVGMKAGDSKTLDVDFGEEYFDEKLQNVKAVYSIELHSVEGPEFPEINDELAQRIGMDDLDALKKHHEDGYEREAEQARTQQIESQILSHLNKEHEFELPKEEVFNETQYMVNRMVTDAAQQGMDPNSLDEHENEIIESAGERATNNLRTRYLLDEIATKEKIEVEDDELSQQVAYDAHMAKTPIKKYIRELRGNNGIEHLRENMRIGKTIAFLKDNAKISEVDPPEETEAAEEDS